MQTREQGGCLFWLLS